VIEGIMKEMDGICGLGSWIGFVRACGGDGLD